MATKGIKVERHSVSEQPHELKYEAKKTGTSTADIEKAKRSVGNQRKDIEQKVSKNK